MIAVYSIKFLAGGRKTAPYQQHPTTLSNLTSFSTHSHRVNTLYTCHIYAFTLLSRLLGLSVFLSMKQTYYCPESYSSVSNQCTLNLMTIVLLVQTVQFRRSSLNNNNKLHKTAILGTAHVLRKVLT